MKKLLTIVLASALLFACTKKEEIKLTEDTLAVKMTQRLIGSINNGDLPDEDVEAYFKSGKSLVVNNNTTIKLGNKDLVINPNQELKIQETASPTSGNTKVLAETASKPWRDCRYTVLVMEDSNYYYFLPISNSPGCPDRLKFKIEKSTSTAE